MRYIITLVFVAVLRNVLAFAWNRRNMLVFVEGVEMVCAYSARQQPPLRHRWAASEQGIT